MEVCTKGYFNLEHNQAFEPFVKEGNFNILRQIYIKILDKEEIKKIFNVLINYGENIKHPVFNCKEGGILIRLNTQKLSKYMGKNMLSTPRVEWINKEFTVRFNVKKYKLDSKYEINKGEKIEGLNFILTNIELDVK